MSAIPPLLGDRQTSGYDSKMTLMTRCRHARVQLASRSPLRDVRRPVVDCFDVETRGLCKRGDDSIEFLTRDHIIDAGEAVRCTLFCKLHGGFGSKIAIPQDDVVHCRPALCVVKSQRSDSIISIYQGTRKSAGIKDSLGASLAANWLHRMRGIAKQSDAAE